MWSDHGVIEAYVHHDGSMGVLVEIGCESDFVARIATVRELAHAIALQIAGMPGTLAISDDQLPHGATDQPDAVLLHQTWVRDPSKTIGDLVREAAIQTGERIEVRRFVRFELGGS